MDSNIITYLRQFRIEGFTVFDTGASFLGVYILAPLLTRAFRLIGIEVSRRSWLYLVLPIGILAHYLSGTKTPMTVEFLDPAGYYLLKLAILTLLVLGLKDIRKAKKKATGEKSFLSRKNMFSARKKI